MNDALATIEKSLTSVGYARGLIRREYRYAAFDGNGAREATAALAAFAQEPPSALTACVGAVTREQVKSALYLGAPVLIEVRDGTGRRWQNTAHGPVVEDAEYMPLRQLLATHAKDWAPERIFRAKAIGPVDESAQLDFVDIGLLPAIEREASDKADALIRGVMDDAVSVYGKLHKGGRPPEEILFRMLFKLLTAKVLRDGGVLEDVDFSRPREVLARVDNFTTSEPLGRLDDAVLGHAARRIGESFPFTNISVDTLAYVYENTLVSSEVRKRLSVHHTPAYVARYVLGRLPLGEIGTDRLHFCDPMCGPGAFLVAALRRLRPLLPGDWTARQRHRYFIKHLSGRDIDPFSVEVAKLTLTLADLPSPDGWDLGVADTYRPGALEEHARAATVFVTNPPFEASAERPEGDGSCPAMEAAEMLMRVLPSLPDGGLAGVIMPLSFLDGRRYRRARELLAELCEVTELLRLPDRIFRQSDAETVVVLARKRRRPAPRTYRVVYRAVWEKDRREFDSSGSVSRDDVIPARRVLGERGEVATTFWVPRSYAVWDSLAGNRTLGEIAEIHRGVEYQSDALRRHRAETVRAQEFPGAVRGVDSVRVQLAPFLVHDARWLSTHVRLLRGGAWDLAWQKPKVLVNAAGRSRGAWRLMAANDRTGLRATQRFHAVWPLEPSWAPVLAAFLNSAVANAYVFEHEGKRDTRKETLGRTPLPPADELALKTVAGISTECERRMLEDPGADLTHLLVEIDAQFLRAYDLPPRHERRLLDLFWGEERPGCAGFKGYFPPDFLPTVPLHVYISRAYQDARADRVLDRLPLIRDPVVTEIVSTVVGDD